MLSKNFLFSVSFSKRAAKICDFFYLTKLFFQKFTKFHSKFKHPFYSDKYKFRIGVILTIYIINYINARLPLRN